MTRATTTKIGGNADYAKVAERLRLFREANPNGKQESDYTTDEIGTVVFTVWLWKDKTDLIELMKSGVTDAKVLRSSADANGTAKGGQVEKKDFEKLESIALGRALANLGYLASGDIASSEEMERFHEYEEEKKDEAIAKLKAAKTTEELKQIFMSLGSMMANKEIISTKDTKKAELAQCESTDTKKIVKRGSKAEKEKSQDQSSETSSPSAEQEKRSDSTNSSPTD